MADDEIEIGADGIKLKGGVAEEFRPAVRRLAGTAESLLRTIDNVVGLPLDYLNRNLERFRKRFAEEFEAIPEGQRQEPPMRVGYAVVRGAAMSADEPAIQDLFAKLLASASDAETARLVHPGFATVISEMQATDAQALIDLAGSAPRRVTMSQASSMTELPGWSSPSLANLQRLGLVEWVESSPTMQDVSRVAPKRGASPSPFGIKPEKALASLTALEHDVNALRAELAKALTAPPRRQLRITAFGKNFLRVVTRKDHPFTQEGSGDTEIATAAAAIAHLERAFPELSKKVSDAQTSFWVEAMKAQGRVLRIAHDGAIKRAATALRTAGPAASGFDVRLPLRVSRIEALVLDELRVLRAEAQGDAAIEIEAVLNRASAS